ncbi:MAG: hypothetical protein Q9227_006047 [Pyrenula ochraceoflavens]
MAEEERELNLVGNVELRIAFADTDEKLEATLQKYLAPLLLKLASTPRVRTKVIEICQHINTRINSSTTKLPLSPLYKQFREQENSLIRHFDLLYVQRAIDRVSLADRVDLLKKLMQDAERFRKDKQGPTLFQLLVQLLPLWKLPERGGQEDSKLRDDLNLNDQNASYLASRLQQFLLVELKGAPQGLGPEDIDFFKPIKDNDVWNLQKLMKSKIAAANVLASGLFTAKERILSAVILSSDPNATLSNIGDVMFKQSDFNLEDTTTVNELFSLYWRTRTRLQTRILSILNKSREATTKTTEITQILDSQLFSSGNSLPSGLEGAKLRAQIFGFIAWTVRVGRPDDLESIAPKAIQSLKEFIESQGWPSATDSGISFTQHDLNLRGEAYESIGLLLPKVNVLPSLDMVKWLFTALRCDVSSSQIFVSIEQAIGKLINLTAQRLDQGLIDSLRPLLLWNMQADIGDADDDFGFQTKRNIKYATVRLANKCLPFHDVDGRWLDLMAIGGASADRSELLEEGRKGLDPYWYRMLNSYGQGNESRYAFPSFDQSTIAILRDPQRSAQLKGATGEFGPALASTITFLRNILVVEAIPVSRRDEFNTDPDWDRKIDVLITTDRTTRAEVRALLRSANTAVPKDLIDACFDGLQMKSHRCVEHLADLCALCPDTILNGLIDRTGVLEDGMLSSDRTTQTQAAKVMGILVSLPKFPVSVRQELMSRFRGTISAWASCIGPEVVKVSGYIVAFAAVQSGLLLRAQPITADSSLDDFVSSLHLILKDSRDQSLRDSAARAIGHLSLCTSSLPIGTLGEDIFNMLLSDAKKEKEDPISSLGRLAYYFRRSEHNALTETTEKLYSLHEIRRPETQFAIGAAFSVLVGGWSSDATISEFDVDSKLPESTLDEEFFLQVMDKIIHDCTISKPSLRKASAIWLLSIIQYCRNCPVLQRRLRQCQDVFARLLSDRDEVVQETGSRGLGLVFEMGDAERRESLVRDLVQSFTGNVSKQGGTVDEETELFEPGALPTGDGSVTTYKDIMNLASEVGEPSLVYRFMNLAANNAIWSSRAAFGRFGLSNVLADSEYLAKNRKFYPKLFRYRFDPNTNVQRAMDDIWNAVVKDPNTVLDENLEIILEDLLKSIVGKEWRVRQASCGALADLIQGREVSRYEKYLDEIWSLGFKVMDDIKESVRAAAMKLCRTLTGILLRNLEIGDGTSMKAQKMLNHALPFLRDQLDSGAAAEVRTYATVTLIDILKKSPPRSIRAFTPQVMETLLSSLSSLEDETVNYLHLNASKYGLTTAKLDEARIAGMTTSPLMEAIERCLECLDDSTIEEAMLRLESSIKAALSLPSKVGCSRVLISLSTRHNTTFRPYASRFIRLVRRQLLDRNESVSVAYSMALGYLARLATESELEETAVYVKKLYFSTEESSHRAISAEVVQSISKVANDKFMSLATAFLPFAFVGRNDDIEQIQETFDRAWKDNVGGSRAVVLYFAEISDLILEHVDSSQWAIKHAVALAAAELIKSYEGSINAKQSLIAWKMIDRSLSGKTWEGKERVLAALLKLKDVKGFQWDELWPQMRKIILREAKRQNAAYRPHGIEVLGDLVATTNDRSFVSEAVTVLQGVADDLSEIDGAVDDKMEVDDGDVHKHISPQLLRASLRALLNITAASVRLQIAMPNMTESPGRILVESAIGSNKREVRVSLYDGIQSFCGTVTKTKSGGTSIENGRTLATGLVLLILDNGPAAQREAENELTRTKRAEAAVAYVETFKRESDDKIVELIRTWKDKERSQSVRRLLEKGLEEMAR